MQQANKEDRARQGCNNIGAGTVAAWHGIRSKRVQPLNTAEQCLTPGANSIQIFELFIPHSESPHLAWAQVLYTLWPPEAFNYNGATEHMPDGRLIFRGPRVAMAIHETSDYECAPHLHRAQRCHTDRCSRTLHVLESMAVWRRGHRSA